MLLALLLTAALSPTFSVTPTDGEVDSPIHINVTGLKPLQVITLRAESKDNDGRAWSATEQRRSDSHGAIHEDVSAGAYPLIQAMKAARRSSRHRALRDGLAQAPAIHDKCSCRSKAR